MSRTDFEAAYIERYGHRPRGWNDDFQVYQDAHANGAWFGWQARAAGIEAKAAPVGEREAFLLWLGIKPCGAAHDLAWAAWKAGAAHQRQQAREVVMPDVSAMAKVLSDRAADACNINRDDNWAMYGQEYIDDVQAMLAAAPATVQGVNQQMLEALTDSLELMETLCAFEGDTIRKARAAIAVAREGGKV